MSMENRTVGECFHQIRNGANIKQGLANGGFPITRIETTANDTFNRDRMGYAGITDIGRYEDFILEDGDLLMSHINSVQYLGRTVLYKKQPGEVIIHGMNLLGLKANRNIILPEYAQYCFYAPGFREQLAKITKKSVNQASFTVSDLKKIVIKVPSLNEQRRTVVILDKTKELLGYRRDELQKLDELIKARFVEMFGDPLSVTKDKKKLSDIGRIYTGNTPSMKNPEYYDSEDIPFVKPGDIAESGVSLIKQVDSFISEKARNVARIIPQDAVLVTCIGTIGKIGIATEECCCNQQINYIVPDADVDSVYLAYCISFFKDVLADMANAPVVPIINKTQFSALEIPVAECGKQIQFSRFVQQVDKSKAVVQKALDEAHILFDSLMQQYFG